ncbi:MAG: hypothetical protein AB7Q97_17805 [Gammaproteobacteria bacterium]
MKHIDLIELMHCIIAAIAALAINAGSAVLLDHAGRVTAQAETIVVAPERA